VGPHLTFPGKVGGGMGQLLIHYPWEEGGAAGMEEGNFLNVIPHGGGGASEPKLA
jgi:hypothetical protein